MIGKNVVVEGKEDVEPKEYTILANLTIVAYSEEEAIAKAKNGEILEIDVVDVLKGVWAI